MPDSGEAVQRLAVTVGDIALARYRLAPYLSPSPLEFAPGLGERVALKLECLNPTHSFKVRGALNAMLALDAETRARGVIAASTGNHAQGIAYAARVLGVQAKIVMPESAPKKKIAGVKRWGSEPLLFGSDPGAVEPEARRLAEATGLAYISPYNDPFVVAGQGTCGLEILDQLPDVERVVVPVGGGGLIAGVAVAVKGLRPEAEIIGVNAALSPEMYNVFYEADLPCDYQTIADALPGDIEAESITRAITKTLVSAIVRVTEDQIRAAMRWLVTEHGCIGEGGGVVGIAALMSGLVPSDKVTAIVVSGGNVDAAVLGRVLA